jgi:hypothetical protein
MFRSRFFAVFKPNITLYQSIYDIGMDMAESENVFSLIGSSLHTL